MRNKNEGKNTFSNYPTIKFTIDYVVQRRIVNSLELGWGGFAVFDINTMRNDIANYNIAMRRYFNSKVKDGYFTDRFIYINELPDNASLTGKAMWFPKVFLFLEEEYEKEFIVDYLKTLFTEIEHFHATHKKIKFGHYEHRKTLVNGN
jgi:hypothetical protein